MSRNEKESMQAEWRMNGAKEQEQILERI